MRVRIHQEPPTYDEPYDSTRWEEHIRRVHWTIDQFIQWHGSTQRVGAIDDLIDLACGDASIPLGIGQAVGATVDLGDLLPHTAVPLSFTGPIEETVKLATRRQRYDLLVCTEVLEHLRDPDQVLRDARNLATNILVTTPVDEAHDSENVEHLWSWGTEDVRKMLWDADFRVTEYHNTLHGGYYTYQLWIAS